MSCDEKVAWYRSEDTGPEDLRLVSFKLIPKEELANLFLSDHARNIPNCATEPLNAI